METRWGGDGRNEEQQGDGKHSPPPPALSHRPYQGLSMSLPGAGQAQKCAAQRGPEAVTGQCRAGTLLSPPRPVTPWLEVGQCC